MTGLICETAHGKPHCHTDGHACYGEICVFPRLCELPLELLTRQELRRINAIRKQCELAPLKQKRERR